MIEERNLDFGLGFQIDGESEIARTPLRDGALPFAAVIRLPNAQARIGALRSVLELVIALFTYSGKE